MGYEPDFMYEADLAFVEVTSCIYLVGKTKTKAYTLGTIVGPEEVRIQLSSNNYKVALCKERLENIVYANFMLRRNDDA